MAPCLKISGIIIFLYICVNTSVAQELIACPDGYIKHQMSCYKFHHVIMSWPEARTFCGAFGSHLLEMETAEENTYIKEKLKEIASSFSHDAFWIGMTDAINQGTWKWSESDTTLSYDLWGPGEPEERAGEDCAGIARHENYHVADYYCGRDKNHVICEIDLQNAPTIVG